MKRERCRRLDANRCSACSTGHIHEVQPVRSNNQGHILYNGQGYFARSSLGLTRAALDMRKKKLRSSVNSKQQMLNSLKKEIDDMHVGMEELFQDLQQKLLQHPKQTK